MGNSLKKKSNNVFIPTDKFPKYWELFVMILLMLLTFMLPYEICFIEESNRFLQVFEVIVTIIFYFDILYNFNRAYKNKKTNEWVTNRKLIAFHYIKTWFFLDFIASFPFFLFSGSALFGIKSIKIIRIFRIVRLIRLLKFIKNLIPNKDSVKSKEKMVKLRKNYERLLLHSLIVFIICHLFACFFYFIPVTIYEEKNWIYDRGLENKHHFEKYLFALHWMIETAVTVGYGENTPHL